MPSYLLWYYWLHMGFFDFFGVFVKRILFFGVGFIVAFPIAGFTMTIGASSQNHQFTPNLIMGIIGIALFVFGIGMMYYSAKLTEWINRWLPIKQNLEIMDEIDRSQIGKKSESLVGWEDKPRKGIGTNYPPMRARGGKRGFRIFPRSSNSGSLFYFVIIGLILFGIITKLYGYW